MYNKDQSVKLRQKIEHSVRAFVSVYARIHTIGDGNCLYRSLSILEIGSEKLTKSMRLLAVNAMINNSDHCKRICKTLNYLFEEQMNRTATDKTMGRGRSSKSSYFCSYTSFYLFVY